MANTLEKCHLDRWQWSNPDGTYIVLSTPQEGQLVMKWFQVFEDEEFVGEGMCSDDATEAAVLRDLEQDDYQGCLPDNVTVRFVD